MELYILISYYNILIIINNILIIIKIEKLSDWSVTYNMD